MSGLEKPIRQLKLSLRSSGGEKEIIGRLLDGWRFIGRPMEYTRNFRNANELRADCPQRYAKNINTFVNISFKMKMLPEEKFPVSETIKIIEGIDLYKTEKWWSAVVLQDYFGKRQLAVYLWIKKGDQWKRKQKFVVKNEDAWMRIKKSVERLLPQLRSTHVPELHARISENVDQFKTEGKPFR